MAKQINILVVDDEQIVLDSVYKHLKKEDYLITGVPSVTEALELLEKTEYDIILTDLMMPHIDGLEFLEMIKTRYPNLPVIMITGYATINTALKATQLGAFDYVAKPFSKTELLGVIKRAAKLVIKIEAKADGKSGAADDDSKDKHNQTDSFKLIGDKSWIMKQEDDSVLMGVDRSFMHEVGRIQSIFLPAKGDLLRQGSVYLQVFSTDLRSHTLISPLSGTVVDINEEVLKDPEKTLRDPYDSGWLVRLEPSNFEYEIKILGL